jgi:hypothetical protein
MFLILNLVMVKSFFYQKTNLGEKTIWALGWPDDGPMT